MRYTITQSIKKTSRLIECHCPAGTFGIVTKGSNRLFIMRFEPFVRRGMAAAPRTLVYGGLSKLRSGGY